MTTLRRYAARLAMSIVLCTFPAQIAFSQKNADARPPVLAPRTATDAPETNTSASKPPQTNAAEPNTAPAQRPRPRIHLHQRPELEEAPLAARLLLLAMPVIFFMWVGASIGSFLNVVIYRMPEGLNLSKPKSRCPNCLTPIRMRHNVPVLGWVALRGRCYDCQTPISMRYPLIEAVVGGFFLLLFLWEFASGASNLPGTMGIQLSGMLRLISSPHAGRLFGWFLWHASLLTILLAMAMMHYDRARVPTRFLAVVIGIPLLIVTFFPWLYPLPVGFDWLTPEKMQTERLIPGTFQFSPVGAATGMLGAVAGMFLFGLFGLTIGRQRSSPDLARQTLHNLFWMGFVTGLFLGWQAVCGIALLSVPACLLASVFHRGKLGGSCGILMLGMTLILILWWREFSGLLDSSRPFNARLEELFSPVTCVVISSLLMGWILPRGPSAPEIADNLETLPASPDSPGDVPVAAELPATDLTEEP